jgi:hypothetical protein
MMGEMCDAFLGLPPLGDVLDYAKQIFSFSIRAKNRQPLAGDEPGAIAGRMQWVFVDEQLVARLKHHIVVRLDLIGRLLWE